MARNDAEIAKVLNDLLTIAKLAMPPKLFGEDPRVTRAVALIQELETGVSKTRPPNISARPAKFDISRLASKRAVSESSAGIRFVTGLPWDLAEALARAEEVPIDPADAMAFVLRDWLTSHGDLTVAPAPEDAD